MKFLVLKSLYPQGPTKAKPSKPADETDSEGIIEDSDEDDFKTSIAPEQSPAPSKTTGNSNRYNFII